MDYERIHSSSHHQHGGGGGGGGGFSPSKLRAILLGIEKQRKAEQDDEEEEIKSGITLRSHPNEIEHRDAEMVSSQPECSTSVEFVYRSRDQNRVEDSFDSDSIASSSVFEFHRAAERVPPHRPSALVPPFSKPAPSKWDDAEKWIASPSRPGKGGGGGNQSMKKSSLGGYGYGNRSLFGAKVALEVTDDVDTKRIDVKEVNNNKDWGEGKAVSWAHDTYSSGLVDKAFSNPLANSAISLNTHDTSVSTQSSTAFIAPPSTINSVSMRDMGTEMTPIVSQEASQTGTPNTSITPTRSPDSSRPLSPVRTGPTANAVKLTDQPGTRDRTELSEKEAKLKTRREIMVLGQQLGKTSIAAWASKEAEEGDGSVPMNKPAKSVNEARAAAWEDAEKAKYMARFKQEEIKIQAWENHQKAKNEAEMRKIEVEVERMRAHAHEKLMNQLATARHKAEEKRAAAEAKRNQQAARTAQQAEYIRRTGQIPTSFTCWSLCS